MDHGIEFFFSDGSHAVKFVEFVGEVVPAQSHHDKQLVEYIVLDVTIVSTEVNVCSPKYVLAGAQVARVLGFGKNDTILSTRTHLGHLLNLDRSNYLLWRSKVLASIRGNQLEDFITGDKPALEKYLLLAGANGSTQKIDNPEYQN
ncbi:hypothetical protein WN944_001584 [Citrus x changshan-huyou]|uniref:60S ribosomal export protein NMD3 OB-fold domain-containing protein n=1 Tax=Citrus x changshan-huyou TaxID=2935761 RepID=A0AAP0MEZ8_9ROSI